ncbi:MAG: FKBP-type peptidyl-prolyl cis-trans isomerase [Victivallaceae bacterium]
MKKELKSDLEKICYALGMNVGQSLGQLPVKIDADAVAKGLTDVLNDAELSLSQQEYVTVMEAFQKQMQAVEAEAGSSMLDANRTEQKEFMAKNKDAEGIVTTASGLQYLVLTQGKDARKPTAKDTVRVHYAGTLLNGTEFDSSVKRGQPAEFGVGQVIKGWTEALQLMNVGSKYKLFIPSELAYGERGAGQLITPGAMLVFEVELLEII